MIDPHDPTLKERLRRRTADGRYEISEIDLILNIRALHTKGDVETARMLSEVLLERSASEFQRHTWGLRHRPDLRDDEGRPTGRPHHVPRALIEPLQPTPTDSDTQLPTADVADPLDQYEHLHAYEESQRILTFLADPLDRKIMVLRAIEHMKWDDIAVICKRTERTIRLRYERARSYLRECIIREQAAYVHV